MPPGSRNPHLDQLRSGPTRISGPSLVQTLARLQTVRELGTALPAVSHLPAIRQHCPKGCDLSAFNDAFIQQIEDKLNDRPRKRLGFRTPRSVFERSFNRTVLRA